jgi:ParB family chromosome partitioning protein
MAKERKVLGRGLKSLIPVNNQNEKIVRQTKEKQRGLFDIPLNQIKSNPQNPRKNFDKEQLQYLANTLKRIGLIQPITVQQKGNHQYQVITGERRFRAAKLAGFKNIPAFVKDENQKQNAITSLIENIQRENLDVIEEAEHYNLLKNEYSMKQSEIADFVGKNRTTINNKMRLLSLPNVIKDMLSNGILTEGQVRPLLSIQNEELKIKLAKKISKESWSARKVEEEVQKIQNPISSKLKKSKKDPAILKLENKLRQLLGTKVAINHNSKTGKGKIMIDYYDMQDLGRVLDILHKKK